MKEGQYQELFLFAAKAGALEGYLFKRRKVEPLTSWIDNLSRVYHALSPEVTREVDPVFTPVLNRVLEYGGRVLEPGLREKLEELLLASSANLKES